jgi:hypothetical protein
MRQENLKNTPPKKNYKRHLRNIKFSESASQDINYKIKRNNHPRAQITPEPWNARDL